MKDNYDWMDLNYMPKEPRLNLSGKMMSPWVGVKTVEKEEKECFCKDYIITNIEWAKTVKYDCVETFCTRNAKFCPECGRKL